MAVDVTVVPSELAVVLVIRAGLVPMVSFTTGPLIKVVPVTRGGGGADRASPPRDPNPNEGPTTGFSGGLTALGIAARDGDSPLQNGIARTRALLTHAR
mgnify:CR=1 FL=1